jgi:hypothetical protein
MTRRRIVMIVALIALAIGAVIMAAQVSSSPTTVQWAGDIVWGD